MGVIQIRSFPVRAAVVAALSLGAALAGLAQNQNPAPAAGKPRLTVTDCLYAGVHNMVFSPDGTKIAVGQPHDIEIFDTVKGKEVACLTRGSDEPDSIPVGFRANGEEFVSCNGKKIIIWDLQRAKVDRTFEPPGMEGCMQLAADGNTVVFLSNKGENVRPVLDPLTDKPTDKVTKGEQYLTVFDLKTGKAIADIKASRDVGGLIISPDGKWAATRGRRSDPKVVVYDLKAGKELLTIDAYPTTKESPITWGVKSLAFSPDGKSLLTRGASDYRLIKWEVATGKKLNELSPKSLLGNVAMAWSPDGKSVVVAGEPDKDKGRKGRFGLWDSFSVQVFDDDIIGELDYPAQQIVFSPDGKSLAVAPVSEDGKSFALWDVPRPGDKPKK
jgi:WD40 repeat protein